MPKPTTKSAGVPRYLRHRSGDRDRAFAYVHDETGKRRRVYLGQWNSAESKRRFRELVVAQLDPAASKTQLRAASPEPIDPLTVEVLVARFLAWKQTQVCESQWALFRYAVRPLLDLYRDECAAEFGPKKLRRVRDEMEASGTVCRKEANRRVSRIRSVFRWGSSEELLPPSVHQALEALPPLRRGRCMAPESPQILPAALEEVEKVLAHATPTVAAMIRLQLLCGARPGEVCSMRERDIDRAGPKGTWLYVVDSHKTAWREQERRIPIGPQAQELIAPFLQGDPDGFVFSPSRSEDERRFMRRQARRSPLTPSQVARDHRRRDSPGRQFGKCWTTQSYRRAIAYACRRAGVPAIAPNRLRHAFETIVEARFGVEAASKALGHADVGTTQHYRDRRDLSVAAEVAKAIG